MVSRRLQILIVIISLISLLNLTTSQAAASGSTFLSADLRTDLPQIRSAGGFRVKIAASSLPINAFPSYTAGWLGIDLQPKTSKNGPQLTQVGIMADQTGIYWFAYSQAPIRCLFGTPAWWNETLQRFQGCKGDPNSLVQMNLFQTVELVNYGQGEWIARVFDSTETGYDVAVITHSGVSVYDVDVNFEEAYIQDEDPYLESNFVFYRPQYNTWLPEVGFVDWPTSSAQYQNYLYIDGASPAEICPSHFAAKTMFDAPRAWYAGTAIEGGACNTALFNEINLPLISK